MADERVIVYDPADPDVWKHVEYAEAHDGALSKAPLLIVVVAPAGDATIVVL